jgi:flap endonuclease-1
MDTLTFNSPILCRHLTFSEAKKQPICEINLHQALEGLDMSMSQVNPPPILRSATATTSLSQFIDLCILLGCDYLEPVKGVGPKTAFKLIKEYGELGKVIEHLKSK